jgi:hypothetical protein
MVTWWMLVGPIIFLLYAIIVHFTSEHLRERTLALIGPLLFLWSFLVLPWVSLNVDCLLSLPVGDLGTVIQQTGISAAATESITNPALANTVSPASFIYVMATNPSGVLLTRYYPTVNLNLPLLVILWAPVLYAIFVLVSGILSLTNIFTGILKLLGSMVFLIGLFLILPLMVAGLPMIDAWGTQSQFLPGLAAILLNAHLGWGVWIAFAALIMMIIGGERIHTAASNVDVERGHVSDNPAAEFIQGLLNVNPRIWIIIGSVLFLISFFALPWLQFSPEGYALNLQSLNGITEELRDPLCVMQGLKEDCDLYDAPWPFTDTRVQTLQARVAAGDRLPGMALVTNPLTTNMLLNLTSIAGVALSVVSIIWSAIFMSQYNDAHDHRLNVILMSILGPLALVVLVSLLLFYPSIDVLGTRGNFQVSLLMAVAETTVGYGAALALIGMALIAIGSFIEIARFLEDDTVKFIALGAGISLLTGIVLAVGQIATRPEAGVCGFIYSLRPSDTEQVQTPGTGDVQITVRWPNQDNVDIDLHVIDPAGEEIYFANHRSSGNGQLDIDSNAGCTGPSTEGLENVFWPSGNAPEGTYRVIIHHYPCGGIDKRGRFEVAVLRDHEVIFEESGELAYNERIEIFSFEYVRQEPPATPDAALPTASSTVTPLPPEPTATP